MAGVPRPVNLTGMPERLTCSRAEARQWLGCDDKQFGKYVKLKDITPVDGGLYSIEDVVKLAKDLIARRNAEPVTHTAEIINIGNVQEGQGAVGSTKTTHTSRRVQVSPEFLRGDR